MSWLDIIIIVIVVGNVVYSLFRGLVREIISLGAVVLAAILATRYCQWGAERLEGLVGNPKVAAVLGFTLIFLGVIALGILLGRLAKGFLKKTGLSPMDKLLGGLLGLLKATVIVAVILMLIDNFVPSGRRTVRNSCSAPIFMPLADGLADFMPRSLFDKLLKDVERGVDSLKEYKEKLQEEGAELKDKYQPEAEKLLPDALKEKGEDLSDKLEEQEEDAKEALEEDREKLRQLLKENLNE